MTVTYHRAPDQKSKLRAESMEIHRSAKTGTYEIKVMDEHDVLIASALHFVTERRRSCPFSKRT